MEYWKCPPVEKVIEALGAIADGRVEMVGDTAKITSSSRGKYYEVTYDPVTKAIMANDNLSFWKGMLGYPSIAFLMVRGVLPYDESVLPLLRDIPWKDLNTKFKGNFRKTFEVVLEKLSPDDAEFLQDEVARVYGELQKMSLLMLGKRVKPPEGY